MVRRCIAAVLHSAVRIRALARRTLRRQDQRRSAPGAEEHRYGNMDGEFLPYAISFCVSGFLFRIPEYLEQLADVENEELRYAQSALRAPLEFAAHGDVGVPAISGEEGHPTQLIQ